MRTSNSSPTPPVSCCGSRALSGRTHDLTAARTHRLLQIRERQGVPMLADRTYQSAGTWVTHRPRTATGP